MKYQEFLERTFLTQEELLALAWGNLVEDCPHQEFLALPGPPMLMLDRVISVERSGNQGRIVAERDVRLDDWFFQCHFRMDPVQPGCLGVDAIWQLIGLYLSLRGANGSGRALGAKEIEFFGQIRPHNKVVRYEVDIRRFSTLKTSGSSIAIGSAKVLVDGEPIYTIRDAKVGTFEGIRYNDYPFLKKNAVGGVMGARENER